MRREMARGAAWMVLFRLLDRTIGILSTVVLARLLVPADFGLVAMAMSVIAIIELATLFSFEIALIQKADPEPDHYNTAWTLNILAATGGAIVTSILAYPAASFYSDPRLVGVMFAIGAAWFVSGFENVGTVDFRRRMDFSSEFRLLAAKRAVSFLITIAAALAFRSYWALVTGMAAGRIAGVVLSYLMQPFRPRLSLRYTRELFSFSGWLLANNIVSVLLARVPHFVIGRMFGAQMLGAYTVGSEIAQLAHTELVAPINRAMFPGYSRLTNDIEAFRRICIDATAAILLVVLPASMGVAVLAEPIVRVLLGTEWSAAAPIIQILAFAGAVSALTSNNVSAYLALGRPNLIMRIILVRLLLFVGFITALAPRYQVAGVAYAELLAALGSLAVSLPILFAALQMRVSEYLSSLWRPLVASCLMLALLVMLRPAFGSGNDLGSAILEIVVSVPAGAAAYVAFVCGLWFAAGRPEGVELLIARRIGDALTARRARSA